MLNRSLHPELDRILHQRSKEQVESMIAQLESIRASSFPVNTRKMVVWLTITELQEYSANGDKPRVRIALTRGQRIVDAILDELALDSTIE